MNTLLHSLRGFKTAVPFTFDSDKAGFDIGKWSKIEQSVVEPKIHFIASTDFENIDFFPNDSDYDFSNLQVYINGELTNQVANSITASAGDDIKIVSHSKPYPFFYPREKDYIASIEEPLPFMDNTDFSRYFSRCRSLVSIPENLFINHPQITTFFRCFDRCTSLTSIPQGLFDNNTNVTSFSYCFQNCTSLTSIPAGLFDNNTNVTSFSNCFQNCTSLTSIPENLFINNPQITSFYGCFYNCTSLTSIPVGLFDNNPNVTSFRSCFESCFGLTSIPDGLFDNNTLVTDFSYCFRSCSALTSIPQGLFDNNPNVTNFSYCFRSCIKLTVNVQIGSTITNRVNVTSFARNTKEKGTVYCKEGSAAYTAFSESADANVNVLTY